MIPKVGYVPPGLNLNNNRININNNIGEDVPIRNNIIEELEEN